MSHNQPRSDKSDTAQYRKTGQSSSYGQQRGSATHAGSGKGGGSGPAPITSPAFSTSNRSFKKSNNHVQGAQTRISGSGLISESSNAPAVQPSVQYGAHAQPPLQRASDALDASAVARPSDSSIQKGTRGDPNTPSSDAAAACSAKITPTTPAKATGDGSRGFPFQFGSLSPGLMNGLQIPARTSSAPPDLDEQKHDQASHGVHRAAPSAPIPSVPRPHLPKKDTRAVDQSSSGEVHPLSKAKRETQVSSLPAATQTLKPSVHSMSGMPMPVPFHQPQVSGQFGGPNTQIQPPAMTLPTQLPLPIGSAPQMQPQMFVPGLPHHSMPLQGIMPQGQAMGFTTQMGPQLGNLGISITSQYPQQHGGKFGEARKPVKITNPKTREELRLGKREEAYLDGGLSGLRPHSNPQPQPMTTFSSGHPINYYTNPYNPGPFLPTSSLPLSRVQGAPSSHSPRLNYPVTQASQTVPHMNSSTLNSLSANKSGNPTHGISESVNLVPAVIPSVPSPTVQGTVKPLNVSVCENVGYSSPSNSSLPIEKDDLCELSETSGEYSLRDHQMNYSQPQVKLGGDSSAPKSLPLESRQTVSVSASISVGIPAPNSISPVPSAFLKESPAVVINAEVIKKESLSRLISIKDHQKKPAKEGHLQAQDQDGGLSIPSPALEHGLSVKSGVSEPIETKPTPTSLKSNEYMLESSEPPPIHAVIPESKTDRAGLDSTSSEVSDAGNNDEAAHIVHYVRQDGFTPQDEHLNYVTAGAAEQKGIKLPEGPKVDNGGKLSSDSTETNPLNLVSSKISDADRSSSLVASLGSNDSMFGEAVAIVKSTISDQDLGAVLTAPPSEATLKHEVESVEDISSSQVPVPVPVSVSKDKSASGLSRSKSSLPKGKKKRKEILQKADAAGTTSDLYMAYKGQEEKKETANSLENVELTSSTKHASDDAGDEDAKAGERDAPSKAEPDDWEDAADISTPKLEASNSRGDNEDGLGVMTKKYSRDFLIKYADQCTALPDDFNVKPDIEVLIFANVNKPHLPDRESYPSPGRVIDRPSGRSRLGRCGSGAVDDGKWSKQQGAFPSGLDVHPDIGYGGNGLSFRPGQGGNYGVLRNTQAPIQYAGGILPGPMQSLRPQGGMPRNNLDADRWQQATGFQKGFFPSQKTPLEVMHKAERKYQIGKITDEEQAKQRQLKAILNKLTPQNFERLFEQVKAVNIDNAVTLGGTISQIFDKALMEPTFCEMYANFCSHLSLELPDFSEDNEKITFKRLLLNKCQEEFERGEREEEEANRVEEGEKTETKQEREEKRLKARRRMLGNIRLIGELYKKRMLTERIMHECIKKLLGQYQTPEEEDIEALCKLMSTIGEMIDHPKAKEHMDAYFVRMADLSNDMKLSSRVRFMLKDVIDLRKNKWQQRRKIEGPKKIEEVHRDAAQERQAQTSRLARGPGINPSARRPMDFSPRGSAMVSSLNAHVGVYRGLPMHGRGLGTHDVHLDDRHPSEVQPLSVPLSQRPIADNSITLGPQSGLVRGMSTRGHPPVSSSHLADISPSSGDSRRGTYGLNGHSSMPDQTGYSPREESIPRYMPERFSHDQLNVQERNMSFGRRDIRNLDPSHDKSLPSSPSMQLSESGLTHSVASEKVLSEEHLRGMSIAAIKEFYSARDENEVGLCIKDLNSPSFYPTMISIWVTDSFEKKDVERDLLAKLLVNLTRSRDGMLSEPQLIKGFEAVLTTLEDAVNDAPKAAEFLGRIFAKFILEKVISLREIGQLIYEGGEEPGNLREVGLAAEILGATLEMIQSEKGDSVLNEIRARSNLRLEDFRHPDPYRSRKLQLFI